MIIGKKEITDAFQKTGSGEYVGCSIKKSSKQCRLRQKTRCPVNEWGIEGEYIHGDRKPGAKRL